MSWNVSMIPSTSGGKIFKWVHTITAATYSGTLSTSGGSVTVYWGDGTFTTYSGTNQAFSHTYSGSSTYTITIAGANRLTEWNTSGDFATEFNLSSLPSVMTYFSCYGSNTVTGNLSSLPSVMTDFYCTGNNTISGNLSSLPAGLTYFYCSGSNTITGSLSSVSSAVTNFYCSGYCTIDDYTTKSWANNQQRVYLVTSSPGGLSSAKIDQLLIDLAAAGGTWSGSKEIYLRGTNAARTSASDAAVATLVGKGVSITTTP